MAWEFGCLHIVERTILGVEAGLECMCNDNVIGRGRARWVGWSIGLSRCTTAFGRNDQTIIGGVWRQIQMRDAFS